MTENRETQYTEEIIDLRELILTLWAKKWVILGAAILAGLAAFVVSKFLVQERYQASAYLTITDPNLRAELETSILTSPVEFETSGLSDLAESAELQQLAFNALGVIDPVEQRAYEFSASMPGEDQLELMATARGPDLAAEAANAWASVVLNRLNGLYGTEEEALNSLEMEVSRAGENWSASQLALETYLPESRLDSLSLQFSAARSKLAKYLKEIDCNQLLISDVQALQQQIGIYSDTEFLSTGTALSLISLQQRAVAVQDVTPLQIQIDQSWQADLTAAEAGVILVQLIEALESQDEKLSEEVHLLEDEISSLVLSQEKEQYQIDLLTQERDLARQAYIALSSQLEETRITLAQEERPVRIGAEAVEPMKPSSPNTLLNSVLAAMIGAMLVVGGVLIRKWWIDES